MKKFSWWDKMENLLHLCTNSTLKSLACLIVNDQWLFWWFMHETFTSFGEVFIICHGTPNKSMNPSLFFKFRIENHLLTLRNATAAAQVSQWSSDTQMAKPCASSLPCRFGVSLLRSSVRLPRSLTDYQTDVLQRKCRDVLRHGS